MSDPRTPAELQLAAAADDYTRAVEARIKAVRDLSAAIDLESSTETRFLDLFYASDHGLALGLERLFAGKGGQAGQGEGGRQE